MRVRFRCCCTCNLTSNTQPALACTRLHSPTTSRRRLLLLLHILDTDIHPALSLSLRQSCWPTTPAHRQQPLLHQQHPPSPPPTPAHSTQQPCLPARCRQNNPHALRHASQTTRSAGADPAISLCRFATLGAQLAHIIQHGRLHHPRPTQTTPRQLTQHHRPFACSPFAKLLLESSCCPADVQPSQPLSILQATRAISIRWFVTCSTTHDTGTLSSQRELGQSRLRSAVCQPTLWRLTFAFSHVRLTRQSALSVPSRSRRGLCASTTIAKLVRE